MFTLSPRQIHLDFHTSEAIEGIGADFCAESFAKTVKDAAISSMTVFARGCHGWLYYDSKAFPERVHPHLANKNLLLDEVRALHSVGVNAPVYITVQWDYYTAENHPEWLIRKADGAHEGDSFADAGFYQSLCINTPYVDFLKAQTTEVLDLLGDELDGIFFDIVGIRPCWCSVCRKEMREKGIDLHDETAVRAFAKFSLERFKNEMTRLVRSKNNSCSIFYNAGHVGPCTANSKDAYTHFELESLPSGGWGYLHFPVTARYARKLGADCMGMTGKFHTSWGDFHSLKNLAALEFEAFRMLSYGFACSIGDQLEPRGVLNPATYRLIGEVYRPFAAREAYARPSKPVVEAALLTAENPLFESRMPKSILGAAQLFEELALQYDILDPSMDFSDYRLVILPDDLLISDKLEAKLLAFTANGGKVLAFDRGGLKEDGSTLSALFGAEYLGREPLSPNFIRGDMPLAASLEKDQEYTIYLQGAKIRPTEGKTVLSAVLPYFERSGEHFCSHIYTPSTHKDTVPCAVEHKNALYFAHPLFTQYYENAPHWVKVLVKNALYSLLGKPVIEHNGPSTACVSLLDQPQENRKTLHVLHYIPVRKSATIDIIEERTPLYEFTVRVNLPETFTKATLVPEMINLPVKDNTITIPKVDGYAIVTLEK